ncbi:MAG TPA: Crp/Fnr family transcriptional regulator [Candidatus Acidoferrales bacterium]|nr:Crp/Fnr family transcriptional regulator [Candidatus Acidoferrales bacterium]
MTAISAKSLQQLKDLARFPLSQLERLAAALTVRQLRKNEIVFDQDEPARLIYLLLSGVVRVSYLNTHEKQTIVSLLPKGEFFGLDSLMPDARHPFRCDAFENCTVGSIRPQAFIEILLGVPFAAFLRWYSATMHSGRQMYIHCIKGIGLGVRKRLALELTNLAARFGTSDARGILIALDISHEALAGIVGASRQQVTAHLNEFDREKIIFRDRRRIIINPQKLRRVIEVEP